MMKEASGISIPGTGINIDDDLARGLQAHELAFPSETRTVWEHFQDALNNPGTFDNSFMSPFKGKVAELETNQLLESDGELLSNLVEIPFQANCRSVRRSRHPVDLAML